jgi:hypothetical protein
MSDPDQAPTSARGAREKREALGAYLNFYTTALKNQERPAEGHHLRRCFAGAGKARGAPTGGAGPPRQGHRPLADIEPPPIDAEVEEYIRARRAWRWTFPTRSCRYVFIERDPAGRRARAERARIRRHTPDRGAPGKAGDELDELLKSDLSASGHRAVVFLDPFGMQIS